MLGSRVAPEKADIPTVLAPAIAWDRHYGRCLCRYSYGASIAGASSRRSTARVSPGKSIVRKPVRSRRSADRLRAGTGSSRSRAHSVATRSGPETRDRNSALNPARLVGVITLPSAGRGLRERLRARRAGGGSRGEAYPTSTVRTSATRARTRELKTLPTKAMSRTMVVDTSASLRATPSTAVGMSITSFGGKPTPMDVASFAGAESSMCIMTTKTRPTTGWKTWLDCASRATRGFMRKRSGSGRASRHGLKDQVLALVDEYARERVAV